MEIVSELKERQKRKVLRQLQNGEIDYDARIDKLIYTETQEELRIDEESDVDSDDWFSAKICRVRTTWLHRLTLSLSLIKTV